MCVIEGRDSVHYGSRPMLLTSDKPSKNNPQPPVVLDVETRVRDWTVTRVLEPSTPGMQEAVAEDANGVTVLLRVPADADAIERVFAEAALARRHRHWGIVHTIGVVDHNGWPIQVVEHVDGLTLDSVAMLAGSLAPEAVCRIGSQLAMILVELHREPGGFHGALSGERVLVDSAGHVRLADLGRARPEQLFRLLSPERRASGGMGSPEDDLYALGGTLIEAALGRPLERTIGWIDTRALGGILPERLIDALDALVAPSGKRLKNAAAVMRVFETLETTLGDGALRLKKAVDYARIGAALGNTAKLRPAPTSPRVVDVARTTLPPPAAVRAELNDAVEDTLDAAPDAPTETALAPEPFAPFDDGPAEELQATDPGSVPPFVPFSDAAPSPTSALASELSADASAEPSADRTSPEPVAPTEAVAVDGQAHRFFRAAEQPTEEIERPRAVGVSAEPAPEGKKKWPLFSRMIAWGFYALLAVNVVSALWVLLEPPLSRATGVALPRFPYADLSFQQMALSGLASATADVDAPGLAFGDDAAAAKLGDELGAALAAELAKAPLDAPPADAEAAPTFGGDDMPALTKDEEQQLAAALAALAAELEKAPQGGGAALGLGAIDAAAAAPVPTPTPAYGAAPGFGGASGRPVGVPRRKVAQPPAPAPEPVKVAKPAKVEQPVKKVEQPVKHEAARPEPVAKPAPAKAPKAAAAEPARAEASSSAERRIIGMAAPARATRPVKLTIEAPAAMRARAEANLRDCELEEPVVGVVRVGSGGKIKSVTTDPLNTCVAKSLKQTLEGFEEDAPFEVTP